MNNISCVLEKSVEFDNLTLVNAKWEIDGLNLVVRKSSLENTRLIVHQVNSVLLENSTLEQLKVSNGSNVSIANCNIDGTSRSERLLLNIIDTFLNITDSSFVNNANNNEAALLRAENSMVEMHNVQFIKNIAEQGLIQIFSASNLKLVNVTFENNGLWNFSCKSAISIEEHCSATISKSNFTGNKGSRGSCLNCNHCDSILVQDSSFEWNRGIQGGAIFSRNHFNFTSIGNNFTHNMVSHLNVTEMLPNYYCKMCTERNHTGGAISFINSDNDESICTIDESNFEHNYGYYGGAIYAQNITMIIRDSIFLQNFAEDIGGAVMAYNKSNTNITNCKFENNSISIYHGGGGGALYVGEFSTLDIDSSSFLHNYGAIFSSYYCTINILNSHFMNQSTPSSASFVVNILHVESESSLTVSDSIFNGTFEGDSVVYTTRNVNATFTNCTFDQNNTLLFVPHESNINIINSFIVNTQFSYNEAVMVISDKSSLNIKGSSITDHKHGETFSALVVAKTQSSVTMSGCLYARNSMFRHIIVSDESNFTIEGCIFYGNVLRITHPGLLFVTESNLLVKNSTFNQNVAEWRWASIIASQDASVTMTTCTISENKAGGRKGIISFQESNVTITSCSFKENNVSAGPVLKLVSSLTDWRTYVRINQCYFVSNKARLLYMVNIEDIAVQSCHMEMPSDMHFDHTLDAPIVVINSQTLRIADSHITSAPIYFDRNIRSFNIIQLYTLQSRFCNMGNCIDSNTTNFLSLAEKNGLISEENPGIVEYEEIQYASGEWNIILLFLQSWQPSQWESRINACKLFSYESY